MTNFFNGRFYPQNFFLKRKENCDEDRLVQALSDEAKEISPDSFDGETPCFVFNFRYYAPYVTVEEFPELRRLQRECIARTRFKAEYNGYIAINVDEWINHGDEEHFENCLYFLADMNEHWKYVFIVSDSFGDAACDRLIDSIRRVIWVAELDGGDFIQKSFADKLAEGIEATEGARLSSDVASMLGEVFGGTPRSESITAMAVKDATAYFAAKDTICVGAMLEYMANPKGFVFSVMTEEEKAALAALIKERKGNYDDYDI